MERPYTGYFDMWRNGIKSANLLDAGLQSRNAQAHRQNILGLVDAGPTAIQALNEAVAKSHAYLASISLLNSGDADLKRSAIDAIDAAATALDSAKPNGTAKALGLDW